MHSCEPSGRVPYTPNVSRKVPQSSDSRIAQSRNSVLTDQETDWLSPGRHSSRVLSGQFGDHQCSVVSSSSLQLSPQRAQGLTRLAIFVTRRLTVYACRFMGGLKATKREGVRQAQHFSLKRIFLPLLQLKISRTKDEALSLLKAELIWRRHLDARLITGLAGVEGIVTAKLRQAYKRLLRALAIKKHSFGASYHQDWQVSRPEKGHAGSLCEIASESEEYFLEYIEEQNSSAAELGCLRDISYRKWTRPSEPLRLDPGDSPNGGPSMQADHKIQFRAVRASKISKPLLQLSSQQLSPSSRCRIAPSPQTQATIDYGGYLLHDEYEMGAVLSNRLGSSKKVQIRSVRELHQWLQQNRPKQQQRQNQRQGRITLS